jgi:hypothetical protein
MSVHADQADLPMSIDRAARRSMRRRALPLLVGPVLVYAVVRPLVSSSTLALGIAGGIPLLYSIVLAVLRRRIDRFALVSGVGFSVACLVSVLSGGSSLPMKVDEAMITFGIGLVLLTAAAVRRPLPVAKLLRIPTPTKKIDGPLGVAVGGFLILHALIHIALAVSLPTSSYVVTSRVVDWGTIALAVLGLAAYRRHVSREL